MEFIPILLIPVFGGMIWLFAVWFVSRGSSTPEVDHERLLVHYAWLQERLEIALRENWDDSMVAPIAEELAAAQDQFARLQGKELPR